MNRQSFPEKSLRERRYQRYPGYPRYPKYRVPIGRTRYPYYNVGYYPYYYYEYPYSGWYSYYPYGNTILL